MEPPSFLNSLDDLDSWNRAPVSLEPDRRMPLPAVTAPEAAQVLAGVQQALSSLGLSLRLAPHSAERLAGGGELGVFLGRSAEEVSRAGWHVLGSRQGEVVAVRKGVPG
ncbi:MAG: hypothetical protein AB1758_03120 [Candidatus Eremiobacterota bacterium]